MKSLRALAGVLLLLPLTAMAQAPPGVARGTVQALDGNSLTVKSANGELQCIALSADWQVSVLKPIDISAIQPGSFIGTAEMPQKDGTGRSIEIHVFPPGVKAGEGHYGWDLRKGSMMTNGTVGKVTAGAKGRELHVTYPNGERQIVVPKDVPIVQITNGERTLLKAGIPVFLIVVKAPDGALSSNAVVIGENGAKPPM